jgi:DnaJ-class molecular chaperone
LFHELTKALEVLTDPKSRAALDASLKAKERQRLRNQALDTKRKKFKLGMGRCCRQQIFVRVKFLEKNSVKIERQKKGTSPSRVNL